MFCYRCGDPDVGDAYWSYKHDCCKDCAGYNDLDRHQEKAYWCKECSMWCKVDEDGCCTTCGADAEVRFKT